MPDFVSYAEQRKDPRWQKRRLEVFERAAWKCEECGAADRELHAHHLRYRSGAKLWEYSDEELRCLCSSCHREWHELNDALNSAICALGAKELRILLGFAEAPHVYHEGGHVELRDRYHATGFACWAATKECAVTRVLELLKRNQAITSAALRGIVIDSRGGVG